MALTESFGGVRAKNISRQVPSSPMQALPAGVEVIDVFDSDCDDFDPEQLLSQPPSQDLTQRRGCVHWSGAALKDLLEIGVAMLFLFDSH